MNEKNEKVIKNNEEKPCIKIEDEQFDVEINEEKPAITFRHS